MGPFALESHCSSNSLCCTSHMLAGVNLKNIIDLAGLADVSGKPSYWTVDTFNFRYGNVEQGCKVTNHLGHSSGFHII